MTFFDSNIHLPCAGQTVEARWTDETSMDASDLHRCFDVHRPYLQERLSIGANFMVFTDRLGPEEMFTFSRMVKDDFPGSVITWLVDFRRHDISSLLVDMRDAGVSAVKFHSYVQEICEDEFEKVTLIAQNAQSLKMPVLIDTSYGSGNMYRYDNLKLAAEIVRNVRDVPVVLLHSGGARVLEAFLLADACSNIYLETSFTLPFYIGSTIERDLAFAYSRIPDRVLYGSDFPYVDSDSSITSFQQFARKWGFDADFVENVLTHNAQKVFG